MSLFDELKRRRVFRVTVAYLVAAWGVLQVADTLFPALHLPPSFVTVVAVLVVLGFPVALLLGWAFDVTPSGVTRTPGSFKFPTRAAAVATIVLALGVTAFIGMRRRAVAARLDANAVAILPFRVSGDASLAAMREGMIDLLAVKLTGEGGGPRAIDARTTLSAFRHVVDDEKDDVAAADAVQLARKLGAGQVLLGAVVGTPGRVALSVELHSSVDGRKLASAEEAAAPDSILPLVDRVVAKLLSQQAGEGRRAEALLSESLTAVRAYLDGQQLLRRGDYKTALQRFNSALEQDSTFALAGLGLASAAGWTEDRTAWNRGQLVTLKYRARLPLPDREFADAAFGYPQVKPALERISVFHDMVARAPDRIEAWHYLGELYYHYGSLVGVEDPLDKALDAWQRALALDSTYMPAIEHQPAIFAERGDTLKLRRLANLIYAPGRPDQRYDSYNSWLIASALQDAAWLKDLRARVDTMNDAMAMFSASAIVLAGLSQQDLPALHARTLSGSNPLYAVLRALILADIGRPAAALDELKTAPAPTAAYLRLMLGWIHNEADTREITRIAEQAARIPSAGTAFLAGQYCLDHGSLTCAQTAAITLRAALAAAPAALPPGQDAREMMEIGRIATAMLDAGLKSRKHAPDAAATLARADSALMHTTMNEEMVTGPGALFTLASTRAHLALGDYQGAYAAAKRGANISFAVNTCAPLLLELARAATRLGKRDEAIAAYRRYLSIRQQPEPGAATAAVEQARHELALVAGEPRK